MAQDFWASSGYRDLVPSAEGLVPTAAWIARFLEREELLPPAEAGVRERELHKRLVREPLAPVPGSALAAVEDADARDNWRAFLAFRDRLLAAGTLEGCYRETFRRPEVDLAPAFLDAMVQAIVRGMLDGTDDPWLCRAGEMLFRRQRVASEGGRVLVGDERTLELYAETGGFGNVGRLLRQQNTPVNAVKMDVMSGENAAFYFLRDELYSFVVDMAPDGPAARAFARVLERWVARMAGVAVTIEPRARIDDERWRWHVGLDVDATAILNALYRGEPVDDAELARLVLLMSLRFTGAAAVARGAERPVHLALACRPDRTLKVKPQNLLVNLPLAEGARADG